MDMNNYIDPEKFPLTTQKGLSLHDQKRIDAFNYDALNELISEGAELTGKQQALWAEHQIKHAMRLVSANERKNPYVGE
jgi:hypothetical protein